MEADGPRIPDRPVCRFRPGHHPPDVFRLRHFRRRHQFRAGAARRALFPRRRADHSAIRGRGLEAVFVSDPRQNRHGELVLAIAGAAVRRFRGAGRVGEGGAGRRAARRVAQAAEGAEGGEAKDKARPRRLLAESQRKAGEAKATRRQLALRPPGCASRRRIRDRLRRSRGCGRCAWRRRGRRRRARSANPCRRPASAWKRRPRW